ncbi:MAG TPA: Gfo/Idh/MocA family oxidoreductase [Acidobacteriaceae bacterium]|nr:Gfo/Idh/MocA family oxidoreductase [Acidobacteriaceae bacterium]
MSTLPPTRIAVIGAGAFGRNHIRVWRELQQSDTRVELAAIVDPNESVSESLRQEFQVPVYRSIKDLLLSKTNVNAASVVVPTLQHAPVATQLLRAGIDVLVEKPIAGSLQEADSLIDLARDYGRILQIGHLERFNPAILAIRSLVHQPLFFEIHRLSVFTPRSLDIDVVMDLMIHDLDLVLSFTQSAVRELHAVGLPVLSSKIDIANVRIEFASGCVANFTASRVSTERVRKMRFFQPHQYVSVDYARQDAFTIDVSRQHLYSSPSDAVPRPPQPAKSLLAELHHPTPEFTMRQLQISPGEPLQLELQSFLHAVRSRGTPAVTGQDGRAALKLALDILEAIAAHQARTPLKS